MQLIPLTGKRGVGKYAFVDDDDYESINRWKWFVNPQGYVTRTMSVPGGHTQQLMHRQIMDAPKGVLIDHVDGNKLNNGRENLRLATYSQNSANRGASKNNKSGYKGVSYDKRAKRWRCSIFNKGISRHLGMYDSEHKAAKAYNAAAIELQGEFARLNVVKC